MCKGCSVILCVCGEFPRLKEERSVGSCVKVHLDVHCHVVAHVMVSHSVEDSLQQPTRSFWCGVRSNAHNKMRRGVDYHSLSVYHIYHSPTEYTKVTLLPPLRTCRVDFHSAPGKLLNHSTAELWLLRGQLGYRCVVVSPYRRVVLPGVVSYLC